MEKTDQEKYNELSYYTLAHRDPSFIHQHIVDAYIAQTANDTTKSISIIFSLVGLYLYLEKSYSGKKGQEAHMRIAKRKKNWQKINPIIRNVLAVIAGKLVVRKN